MSLCVADYRRNADSGIFQVELWVLADKLLMPRELGHCEH